MIGDGVPGLRVRGAMGGPGAAAPGTAADDEATSVVEGTISTADRHT